MKLADLIETLQELADEHGEECEVRLAQQPRWSFEYSIGEVVAAEPDEDNQDPDSPDPPTPTVIYIGEGQQLGYLPDTIQNQLGWGR